MLGAVGSPVSEDQHTGEVRLREAAQKQVIRLEAKVYDQERLIRRAREVIAAKIKTQPDAELQALLAELTR